MMAEAGYDKVPRAAGLIAAGGIIAPVIPPIDRLHHLRRRRQRLDHQAVPRRHLSGPADRRRRCAVAWWWVGRKENVAAPPRKTLAETRARGVDGVWALLMPVVIIGGLKFGIFTPTEAGGGGSGLRAVRAACSSIASCRSRSCLRRAGRQRRRPPAWSMFLVAAALVSAWLITRRNRRRRSSTCSSRSWATRRC